jgi:hypothetical protein
MIRECLHPKFPNQVLLRFSKWLLLPRGFVHVLAPESRTESSLDSRISKSPKFRPPAVEVPGFCVFMTSPLHRIEIPELCTFANPKLRRSRTSWIREFPAPEKHTLRMPLDCDVSRVMCFPEFPNNEALQSFLLQ